MFCHNLNIRISGVIIVPTNVASPLAISIASCTQTIKPVKIKGAMSALKGKLKIGTAIESLTRNYIDVPMEKQYLLPI